MNKKQVTAFLKIVSKDKGRETLTNAYIDEYDGRTVMVGTDGYKLAMIYLDEDADNLRGKMIRRDALERWARAASGKDRLTGEALQEVSRADYALHNGYYDGKYPDWKKVIPTGEKVPQDSMTFNGEFAKIIQDLDGGDGVTLELYGAISPMVARTELGIYIIMPMYQK